MTAPSTRRHPQVPGAPRSDRWATWDTGARYSWRRLLVVVTLAPLLLLLVMQLPRLSEGQVLAFYGMSVLGGTVAIFYLAFARYDDPSDPRFSRVPNRAGAPPLPDRPRVTLLVAVMNEVEVIDACVRSMVGSDYPDLEVVVVDDCSTDGTRDRLHRLESELPIRCLYLAENVGKKRALVAGAALASGEVLAFTDSDCVLAPDALRRCVAALVAHPGLGAVSGHARAMNGDATLLSRVQDAWYEGSFRVAKAAESTFGTVTCVSGPLAVFRRDAVWPYLPAWAEDRFLGEEFRFATDRQLTGYVLGQRWMGAELRGSHADPRFSQVGHVDREWAVAYVRSAKVLTVVPESLDGFLRQQVRWKKSFIRNLFFTGRFMWRRGAGPAALYYGHALWVVAAPLMAVRHLVWAPLAGLWLLTALYLSGVLLKGVAWGVAFMVDNPGSTRWRYRPLMSLISSVVLSWLLPYSLLTIRRGIWTRSP